MSDVHPNLVGGRAVDGVDVTENRNPSDPRDVVGRYALASADQAREALAAAREAAGPWAATTPLVRFDLLNAAATEILRRRDRLADLLAREEGKTLPEAAAEVTRAAQIFAFHAGQAIRPHGELVDSVRPGVEVAVTREPVGVVTVVTPWNFPIAIPAWKVAPALAYGNTVVLKPAELVPGSAWELVDVLRTVGVPDGVVNLVMGRGREVGDVLTSGADAVSFTGSVATGEHVLASAQAARARVQLEMGGKNPLVVLDDADLDVAVEVALQGAFGSTGQRCTASSRLVVTDGVHDAFVERLTARMRAMVVGDARAEGTQMGPVVDATQLAQDEHYLTVAAAEGGEVVGGERADGPGYFLRPALVLGTRPGHTVNREEVFGPVASVVRVGSYDEALAVANDTEFGLCAGVVTTSLAASTDFRRRSTAGMVMVNLPTAGVDFHVPFGGRRGSSYGPREQGEHAREFYTTVKTSYVAAGTPR